MMWHFHIAFHPCYYALIRFGIWPIPLSSLQFWQEIFSFTASSEDKTRPQNREISSLLFARRTWVFQCPLDNICSCHSKGCTLSSVMLRTWVLVPSGAWTLGLPHGSPALYNLSWSISAYPHPPRLPSVCYQFSLTVHYKPILLW